MPICVISTTGTSVFSNASKPIQEEWKSFRQHKGVDLKAILGDSDFEGYALYLRTIEYLRGEARTEHSKETIRDASAELKSLSSIIADPVTRSDELHFLATATPDGALAARVMGDFTREFFGVENVYVHLIEGLQVVDGKKFLRDGIRNLIAKVYDILQRAPAGTYARVINPTSGFKGVVPYLTLIGMIEQGVQLSYIYERAEELITLERIPLQFDFDVLKEAYPALQECIEDFVTEQRLKELLALAPDEELYNHQAWSLFDHLVEDDVIYFSINGLGLIVLEHLRLLDRVKIYLSRQAADRYDGLDNTQRKKFEGYFNRMKESGWVTSKRHDDYQNPGNAIAIKPGNVDERLFIYIQDDGSILIAELAFHRPDGSYDRIPQRQKDYDTFRLWEASR